MLVTIAVVKAFLNSLQTYFTDNPIYGWTATEKTSKIIIMDKFATTKLQQDKYPQIITSRGNIGWGNQVIGQFVSEGSDFTRVYGDIIQGSMSINCLAQNAMEAAFLAEEVFKYLTTQKNALNKRGILKISNLTIGDEQILDQDSKITVSNIPVMFSFTGVLTVSDDTSMYELSVFSGRDRLSYERQYTASGNFITMVSGESVSSPWVVYTSASTLDTIKEVPTHIGSGVYELTQTPLILYPMLQSIKATIDLAQPYWLGSGVYTNYDEILET